MERPTVRPARPDEGPTLSALALRSKAVWGYDAAFLERCRDELTITPDRIAAGGVVVSETAEEVVGLVATSGGPPYGRIDMLFVDPDRLRRGHGRVLLDHAAETARAAGLAGLEIDSDPDAEGFYLAAGAVRVGSSPSGSVPGRFLPRLRLDLG